MQAMYVSEYDSVIICRNGILNSFAVLNREDVPSIFYGNSHALHAHAHYQ